MHPTDGAVLTSNPGMNVQIWLGERRSIFGIDSLVELATDMGLNPEAVREALETRQYRGQVGRDGKESPTARRHRGALLRQRRYRRDLQPRGVHRREPKAPGRNRHQPACGAAARSAGAIRAAQLAAADA